MLIGSLGAREDCAEGLLKRIAQKDCLVGLGGCLVGAWWFLKWRSHMPRTRVSGWDQGFGCWEFSDMAWVIKKWRRGRACRGAARAASVGKCRSRCVRCMCGRAACAVCRRPAWRRGRRARAAHKYRLPAEVVLQGRSTTYIMVPDAICITSVPPDHSHASVRLP